MTVERKLRATRSAMRSPLAVLWFFAAAATVRAECAWVLWQHDRYDYAKLERYGAYDSLAQCEEVARGELELVQRLPGATAIVHKGTLWRLTVLPDVYAYECWPDTVDPRGPKGK